MPRSILIAVATLVAGFGVAHAQLSGDPHAVAPVVYGGAPDALVNCADNPNDPSCVSDGSAPPGADYPPDYNYVPDYWEAAPAYAGPSFYLGVSLVPDYWGWPWY